jgi:putative OPT family oligopeptide transporter
MAESSNVTTQPGKSTAAEGFKPYVPDDQSPPEFTLQAVVTGTCLGLIFAASSLYLVLKVGMTVSASIPVAVLAITLFRAFARLFRLRQTTILENNIVQTSGSAGESIAFGVGVTMPALLLLGFQMDPLRIMVVSVLGGLLGILAMIPLRRAFIVNMHGRPGQPGTLLFPEGTACAQVLIQGEKGGTGGQTVFLGFGLAFVHKFLTEGFKVVADTAGTTLTFINKAASLASAMASELLGVGYIIGLRTSAVMMAGAVLGYLVIIPLIYFAGSLSAEPVPPGTIPIRDMSIKALRDNYLLFIGAGCVATAGIISMLRTLPMIVRSVSSGLSTIQGGGGAARKRRTEDDMPMTVVFGGSLALIAILAVFLAGEVGVVSGIAGAVLVVLFGFLFVTVSSRLTGEIGSSSNPISGMTVATLMVTCLIFLGLGWTTSVERLLALSVAAVVCIAASNGGTTAQSLKTGFLVGGTPKYMQWAILAGALVSALVIGGTLIYLNQANTVYSSKPENLPDYTLTSDELARLRQLGEADTHEGKRYLVWSTQNDQLTRPNEKAKFTPRPDTVALAKARPGMYLVDPDTGKLAYLKDAAIMGRLSERDDGSKVNRDFDAPKTQVMGLIINGVMGRDLNWSMVAMGAMIALMLELCSVSALAFAVGVYVPIQFSAPIFLGGICRWAIDAYLARQAAREAGDVANDPEARARAEIDAIRKSETSPGVLLASGYIAGGSLAGVVIAFFAFSPTLEKDIATYEHGTFAAASAGTLEQQAEAWARAEMQLPASGLTERQEAALKERVAQIVKLNKGEGVPERYVRVPAGTTLRDPERREEFTVSKESSLADVALERMGRAYKAQTLFKANESKLILPNQLPAGATLYLPKSYWPSIGVFAFLIAFLIIVGAGWLFPPPKENNA